MWLQCIELHNCLIKLFLNCVHWLTDQHVCGGACHWNSSFFRLFCSFSGKFAHWFVWTCQTSSGQDASDMLRCSPAPWDAYNRWLPILNSWLFVILWRHMPYKQNNSDKFNFTHNSQFKNAWYVSSYICIIEYIHDRW